MNLIWREIKNRELAKQYKKYKKIPPIITGLNHANYNLFKKIIKTRNT